MENSVQQLCTFHVDGLYLGIDVQEIQEVVRHQKMTRVPLAPREISGLINLRGQIVTAIDLRRRLQRPDRPPDKLPMNVVVRTRDGIVSLLVDEIGDVQQVRRDAFEAPPETLRGDERQHIRGCYQLDGRLLMVLETRHTLELPAV